MAAYLVVDAMLDKPDLYETYKLRAKPLVECTGSDCLDTVLQLRPPCARRGPDGLRGVT